MIELSGQQVVLRALEREHCQQLWREYEVADPPTETVRPGLSIEGADKWFEDIQDKQEKEQVYVGIFSREGELLGDVQLANIDWRHRTASVGIGISRSQNRGRGYATDAVRTLVTYGFEHLDLYRIWASTLALNTAAQRVLEKCGFRREGVDREAVYLAGQRHDSRRYGLLRTDEVTGS